MYIIYIASCVPHSSATTANTALAILLNRGKMFESEEDDNEINEYICPEINVAVNITNIAKGKLKVFETSSCFS